MLTRSSRRVLSERINNEGSPAKKRKVDQASKKTIVKYETSEPLENEIKIKKSNKVEKFNPGPSTSQTNNITLKNDDDIKENLPLHVMKTDTKKYELEDNKARKVDQASKRTMVLLEENKVNIVDYKLIKKEEVESDTEDIVELDVKRQVLEVVLSSDDEDETPKLETKDNKKRLLTPMDESHPSGSSGRISQTRNTASSEVQVFTIKSEESSPVSTLTPKTKKLVLDPSILTPPTGDLFLNAVKYYKCLKFLEQSDLDPRAKEFVPSPKAPKKVADKPTDCVVCLEPRETTFVNLPCRHAVTCGPCSDQLELLGKDCPVCRTAIKSRFQIFN